jgi:serine/threonine-protein phosphatase 2A regulatory subunit B''
MKYFYDEQIHRMEYLQHETVNFNDLVCQLHDMIKPQSENQWTLNNFMTNKQYASVFFNNLLNLNKFLAYEQKDPFSRTEIDKNPELTDWDKFACHEYQRKLAEENDNEGDDVIVIIN